jgi:hypothetical protein
MVGPSAIGSENGTAQFDDVGARFDQGVHQRYRDRHIWITCGDEWNQRLATSRLERGQCVSDSGHIRKPSPGDFRHPGDNRMRETRQNLMPDFSATVCMSLSPRPDRFTSSTASFDMPAAIFIA